jgi:predicted nucleotidyltransferase
MDEESDIDILIEFEGRKSLLDLVHLKNELEDAVNRRVDVLTYRSLHTRLRDRILAEQVPIL